jgi:O-antigen ligase
MLPDRRQFMLAADYLAAGVAMSLPWSTSATSILIALWLIAVLPTLSVDLVRREIATAAGGQPVLLWLIAAAGMLWADVPWTDRLHGLESYVRLLTIPLLLAQFRRSENGTWVLYGYFASATVLLAASWAFALIPALTAHGNFPGVPVKNYIIQTDEFLVCGFALLGFGILARGSQATRTTWALVALGALFLANLAFVVISRTGLVVAPFLIAALGWRLAGVKGVIVAGVAAIIIGPALWLASPNLRNFTLHSVEEARAYFTSNSVTSTGLHIEFLRKSVAIVEKAPLVGHGTGSITEEFRRLAAGESGASGVTSGNPHNQIFAVAIQLGALGAAVLFAMWIAHFLLFRGSGPVAWIGMVVVIENFVSSVTNSHLFDFAQGWLYVFAVGVTGGLVLRQNAKAYGVPS